jgi:hypothetical protein
MDNLGKNKKYTSHLCPEQDFSTASGLVLGLTQPHIQWVLGTLSPEAKQSGREADYSPPPSVEIKNVGPIPPLPHVSSWRSA